MGFNLTETTYRLCAAKFERDNPGCQAYETTAWRGICTQKPAVAAAAERYARLHGWRVYVFVSPSQVSEAPKRAATIYAKDEAAAMAYIGRGLRDVTEE